MPWVTNSKIYSSINSSKVGEENKDRKVGKNDFLWDTHALEGMFLNATQQVDLGNDAHIANNLFEIIGYTSTTPLFGYGQGIPTRDNHVTLQLQSIVWYVRHVFFGTNEVENH